MPWDDDKSTAADPDNPAADEQLTADEWDAHVNEGHWPGDELNLSVNGSGDPVITDPQNGDQEVMRYDRSAGGWVVTSISTEELSTDLETATDVSASRSFGTPYQNSNGYDLLVYILTGALASGESGSIVSTVAATESGLGSPNQSDRGFADGDVSGFGRTAISFRVPDGYYYSVDTTGDFGANEFTFWNERGMTI